MRSPPYDRHETSAPVQSPDPNDGDIRDILAGLSRVQKTLPARLFYDEAGCALFGRITGLPEYYVTRAEMALLAMHADAIVSATEPGSALIEYGASDEAKGAVLLQASGERFSAYVPIDIAGPALRDLRERMRTSHPGLEVIPVVADFTAPVQLPASVAGRPRLGFFPGSTIGNFEPELAIRFLRQARLDLLRGTPSHPGGGAGSVRFVIGTDLRKDRSELIPAYDDAAGVTAAFNRNILRHVNRIAEADFDPELFSHRAVWNEQEGRIEMHLVSRLPQSAIVAGRQVSFAAGETIHTENSYKHSKEGFLALARAAGWVSEGFWTDPDGRFGMHRLISS